MYIKNINFGKIDANNELQDMGSSKYLESFFDYDKYHIDDFIKGNRYYICGDKGTGKTALLKYLEIQFKQEYENLVIAIRFKSDIDELDKKEFRCRGTETLIGTENDYVNIDNAREYSISYLGIWQVFLIHKILEKEQQGEYEIFENNSNLSTLKKLIDCVYKKSNTGVIPKIKKGKIDLDINLFNKIKADIGIDLNFNETIEQSNFSKIIKAIINYYCRLTCARTKVYVLLDELELSVKNTKTRKQDIELVRDLILAISKLNEISRQYNYHVNFIASIRSEVINDVQSLGAEINKCIEDFGITVNWYYKGGNYTDNPLLKIVEKKIHASEKENGEKVSENIWNTYFEPIINNNECRKYILSYSWQKPRDIIRMLNFVQEEANLLDKKFTQEMFDRALQKYSERAWNEICEELILTYSRENLELIKNLFTGISIPFTAKQLLERAQSLSIVYPNMSKLFANLNDILKFLKIMYRWGIIGNTGKIMRFSFLGNNDLIVSEKIVIHKPLRNFFSVKGGEDKKLYKISGKRKKEKGG